MRLNKIFMPLFCLLFSISVLNGAETNNISVLFTGFRYAGCGYDAAATLYRDGFNIRTTERQGLLKHRLTLDELKKYNTVVLTGLGRAAADNTLSDLNKDNISALLQYVKEGGGIVYIPTWVQDDLTQRPQNAFANKIGMNVLFEEIPYDPAKTINATAWNIPFALTQEISDAPVTEGVNALWYPVATRVGAGIHTMLFNNDTNWTTVIRSGKKSFSKRFPLGYHKVSPDKGKPGVFTNGFPLVSVRQYGKGRIGVFSVEPKYLYDNNAATTLENIVAERGLNNIPSDGWKIFENLLSWTAAPSADIPSFGGEAMDKALIVNPHKVVARKPWNWSRAGQQMPLDLPALSGVIGARTRYTTGNATVSEWVAKAKDMGLQYLVFLEKFSELTPEELAALKKECYELSDDTFLAVPGYTIDDEIGNHYFFFAPAVPYPEKKYLDDAGKVFVSRDVGLSPDAPRAVKGQLAMTLLDFALGKHIQFGPYLFTQDASPFPNWFSNWDASGIMTFKNGKLIEDSTDIYLEQSAFGQGPHPYVINLMDTPSVLDATRWRTIFRMPVSQLGAYFGSRHFFPPKITITYVSEGPVIDEWRFNGPRDYTGRKHNNPVWQDFRWKVIGSVKSDVGIKEIRVMDGPVLFRRFLPGGTNEFSFTLDLSHNQQHTFVMIVTDENGKRAISHEQIDRNHLLEEFSCSDRNNQLTYGLSILDDNTTIQLGGNQLLSTPNKRVDNREISPPGVFNNDYRLGTPAFDGGTVGEPVFMAPLKIILPDGKRVIAPRVCEAFRLLHSGDVNIGEGRNEYRFTDNIKVANVWHTLWAVAPSEDYTSKSVRHFFQISPTSPIAVFRWDLTVTLKKNLPNDGMYLAFIRSGKERLWTIRSSNGQVLTGRWDKEDRSIRRNIDLPVEPGGYAAFLDSSLGGCAVYPLSPGIRAQLRLPGKSNIGFFVPPENMITNAGESITFSFIMVGIPRTTKLTERIPSTTTEIVERFRTDYGLGNTNSGYKIALSAGNAVPGGIPLLLDGSEDSCISGVISGDLISSLPMKVTGMNERWSSLLYYRQSKKERPLGVFDQAAWATIEIKNNRENDIFIGHPVICDNDDMFIQVTKSGTNQWTLQINNPLDKPVTITVTPNKNFDPLIKKGWKGETITIPAGTMVTSTI